MMKKILAVVLLLFVVGCTGKYSKFSKGAESGNPEETAKQEVVKTEFVEEMDIVREEESLEEIELSLEKEAKSVFKDILFDYDKYNIKENARPVLDTVASFLHKNRKLNIAIEGYCDERGTNDYNLALGEKRAKATKSYLVSLGVSPSRMETIAYGEEKPLCSRQNETCWQRNRRSHFVVLKETVLSEPTKRDNLQWSDRK